MTIFTKKTTEKPFFVCAHEGCTRSADSEFSITMHYGERHAVKERLLIGNIYEIFYIENEENFKAWQLYLANWRRVLLSSNWDGPGWYTYEIDSYIKPLKDLIENVNRNFRSILEVYKDLKKLENKQPP